MNHSSTHAVLRGQHAHRDLLIDKGLSWPTGSATLRTLPAQSSCERTVRSPHLAIGICFQNPGSAVQWYLDGKLALDKKWAAIGGSRDLIVLPPGQEFRGCCRGSGQGLWLFTDPLMLESDPSLRSFAGQMRIDTDWVRDRLCCMISNELKNEVQNDFPRGVMFLEAASMAFLTQLQFVLNHLEMRSGPVPSMSAAKLRLVLEFIEANLDHNVTLAELAALVGLTPRYFCDVFKRAMGRPPHQFQIERRVERAKTLLLEPDASVGDVALRVGFSSQSHLNLHFRRILGITPARYREAVLMPGAH